MPEALPQNPPESGSAAQKVGPGSPPVETRFEVGKSGNPGGRPKGLARTVRELVGSDGAVLAQIFTSIAVDEKATRKERMEAAAWLADRGWGKAPAIAPVEDADPLEMAEHDADAVAGQFEAKLDELAERRRKQDEPE